MAFQTKLVEETSNICTVSFTAGFHWSEAMITCRN